jgi:hypothetical protein
MTGFRPRDGHRAALQVRPQESHCEIAAQRPVCPEHPAPPSPIPSLTTRCLDCSGSTCSLSSRRPGPYHSRYRFHPLGFFRRPLSRRKRSASAWRRSDNRRCGVVDHRSSHRAPGSNPLRTTSGPSCSPSHPNTVSRLPLRRHHRKTPFLSHTRPRVVLPGSHFVRQRYSSLLFSTPRTLVPVRWRASTLSWTGAPTVRYSICQSEPESQQSTRWQQSAISDLFCPATAVHLLSLRPFDDPRFSLLSAKSLATLAAL